MLFQLSIVPSVCRRHHRSSPPPSFLVFCVFFSVGSFHFALVCITLQGTNISHQNGILKIIFLFPRWDMLIPWRVLFAYCYFVILPVECTVIVWPLAFTVSASFALCSMELEDMYDHNMICEWYMYIYIYTQRLIQFVNQFHPNFRYYHIISPSFWDISKHIPNSKTQWARPQMSILGGPLLEETEVEAKKHGNVMAWKTLWLWLLLLLSLLWIDWFTTDSHKSEVSFSCENKF